jgi:hypothetical protein
MYVLCSCVAQHSRWDNSEHGVRSTNMITVFHLQVRKSVSPLSIIPLVLRIHLHLNTKLIRIPPLRRGFDPGKVHVGFVVDKVALGQVFPPSTSVFPCKFHSTGAPLLGKKKKLIIFHFHHRVAHNALRLRCVRSFCCGALHHKNKIIRKTSGWSLGTYKQSNALSDIEEHLARTYFHSVSLYEELQTYVTVACRKDVRQDVCGPQGADFKTTVWWYDTPCCVTQRHTQVQGSWSSYLRHSSSASTVFTLKRTIASLTSGFRRDVNDIFALLGFFAAQMGSLLPTFRDDLSVQY